MKLLFQVPGQASARLMKPGRLDRSYPLVIPMEIGSLGEQSVLFVPKVWVVSHWTQLRSDLPGFINPVSG